MVYCVITLNLETMMLVYCRKLYLLIISLLEDIELSISLVIFNLLGMTSAVSFYLTRGTGAVGFLGI